MTWRRSLRGAKRRSNPKTGILFFLRKKYKKQKNADPNASSYGILYIIKYNIVKMTGIKKYLHFTPCFGKNFFTRVAAASPVI
jgi:hypothetical protein